jgi:hypothetical protein
MQPHQARHGPRYGQGVQLQQADGLAAQVDILTAKMATLILRRQQHGPPAILDGDPHAGDRAAVTAEFRWAAHGKLEPGWNPHRGDLGNPESAAAGESEDNAIHAC